MKKERPRISFAIALARIGWVNIIGWFLAKMGLRRGRRYNIMMYKAMKKMLPALREFCKIPTSPIGVTEGDIDSRKLCSFIRNIRKDTLGLRY